MLHHETFLRYQKKLNQPKAETRELIERKDDYKLLSEQHEGKVKKLKGDLEAARKEYANLVEQVRRVFEVSDDESDTVANGPNPHVQQKIDQIRQLQVEVDAVKVEVEECKKNMDHLALEKETARAQLTLAKV